MGWVMLTVSAQWEPLIENEYVLTPAMESRLQYKDQHSTFDRHWLQVYDYTVWGAGLDPIANYMIMKTKDLPSPYGWVMWLELAKTRSQENVMLSMIQQWPWDERGICQLRYRYHKPFMDSPEFFDPYNQIDYCVDVYRDRYNKKRYVRSIQSVRAGRTERAKHAGRFKFK